MENIWYVIVTGIISITGMVFAQLIQNRSNQKNLRISAKIQHNSEFKKSREKAYQAILSTSKDIDITLHYLFVICESMADWKNSINVDGFTYSNMNQVYSMKVMNPYNSYKSCYNDNILYFSETLAGLITVMTDSIDEMQSICADIAKNQFRVTKEHIKRFSDTSLMFKRSYEVILTSVKTEISNINFD